MTSADDAIRRWADRMEGKTDKKFLTASNVYVDRDRIYSYGNHFELARPLRDKKGRITGYLLNGDRYSVTTAKHQSHVRNCLRGKETVIVPYSALEAAGIDRDSIKVLERLDDRTIPHKRHSDTMPEGAVWHKEDIYADVERTDEELRQYLGEYTYARYERGEYRLQSWQTHKRVVVGTKMVLHMNRSRYSAEINVTTNDDGSKSYDWDWHEHRLGESLIRAKVTWTAHHECKDCDGSGRGIGPGYSRISGGFPCYTCSGVGQTTTRHHRWASFLSGFDHQESIPLYFFCEMPRDSKATTVAEAYEDLKPDPVKLAEQMGRKWTRQGDIFAVPTRLDRKALKARGARFMKRKETDGVTRMLDLAYILNTNHTATEVAYLPGGLTLARGVLYHDPAGRRPDHARRKLGDGKAWHIVAKNTVPTNARR